MRLPDPFTSSEAPGFNQARLTEIDPQIKDALPDGSVLRVSTAAQIWLLELSYPDLFKSEFDVLIGSIAEAKRLKENLEILLPQYEVYNVTGDATTATIVSGQQGSQLEISNTGSLSGVPKVNDLFQLSSHNKVYKITNVEVDSGTGNWTLSLYPDLLVTTTGTEKPKFNNILFSMTLEEDNLPEDNPSVDLMYRGVTLLLRENLNHGG